MQNEVVYLIAKNCISLSFGSLKSWCVVLSLSHLPLITSKTSLVWLLNGFWLDFFPFVMVHFWKYIIMRTWFKQKICEEKEEKGEKALFVSTGAKGLIDWENIGKRTQVVWFNWQKVVQETFGNVGHALKCCFTLVWGEVVNETRVWLSFWTPQYNYTQIRVYIYVCMQQYKTLLLQFVEFILQESTDRWYCLSIYI